MGMRYPNLATALAAAVELRRIAQSRRWLQNVPLAVNDLWTLQGTGLYFLFGSQQQMRALPPEDSVVGADFFSAMGPPRVSDDEFCDAVDKMIAEGREFGSAERGDSFSEAIPGFRADRIRWDQIVGWCYWNGAIMVARLSSGLGQIDGVGAPGAPAPE